MSHAKKTEVDIHATLVFILNIIICSMLNFIYTQKLYICETLPATNSDKLCVKRLILYLFEKKIINFLLLVAH
jgi:hypothetical protein